ncbi:translocation/assembly module TamB domain-containing protein [Thermodesulfobacteriota bacterium]
MNVKHPGKTVSRILLIAIMKRIKQISIAFSLFLGLTISLMVAGSLYLNTDHARRKVQETVNKRIPGSISLGKIKVSLPRGRIELTNVLLQSAAGEDLARCDRFLLDFSWLSLFSGKIWITELSIEKPNIGIRIDPEGNIDLLNAIRSPKPQPPSPEKKGKKKDTSGVPFDIVVASLKITDGSIHCDMMSHNMKVALQDIGLVAEANLLERFGKLSIDIGRTTLDSPAIQTRIDPVRLNATFNAGRIDPLAFQLGSEALVLNVSGKIDDIFSKPVLDLALDLDLSLSEIRKNLMPEKAMDGQVRGHMTVLGMPDNPDLALRLDYGGGVLAGVSIEKMTADLRLKNRQLNIDPLIVNAASGELRLNGNVDLESAFSRRFPTSPEDFKAVSYQFHLIEKKMMLKALSRDLRTVDGTVNSVLNLEGRGISLPNLWAKADLEIRGNNLSAPHLKHPATADLKIVALIEKSIVQLKIIDAATGDIRLHGDGRYELLSDTLAANLNLDAPDLSKNLFPLGIKDARGNIKLQTDIAGSLKRPIFNFMLDGAGIGFQDLTLGNVVAGIHLDPSGMLKVTEISVNNNGSVIQGSGTAQVFPDKTLPESPRSINFTAMLRDVKVDHFIPSDLSTGNFNGNLQLAGSLEEIQASLSLTGKQLSIKNVRLGNLSAQMRLAGEELHLDQFRLQNQNSTLSVAGSTRLFAPGGFTPLKDPLFRADIKGDAIFLEDFVDHLSGRLSVNAELAGNLRQPKGPVEITGKDLNLTVQRLKGFNLSAELDAEKALIRTLEIIVAPGESITGSGWISLDQSFDLNLITRGINLQHIDRFRDQEFVRGMLVFDLAGQGSLDNPKAQGNITIEDFLINGKPMDNVNLRLDLQDQRARVFGKLNFDIDGQYHLNKKDFSLSLRFDQTDLGPYFRLADRKELNGTLTGTIQAEGNADTIHRIRASADMPHLDLFYKDRPLLSAKKFNLVLENEAINIPGLHLILSDGGKLEIKGTAKLNGPVAVEANGNIPLKILNIFVEDLSDITGNMRVNARMEGTFSEPEVRAEINLEKIGFIVPAVQQKLHAVSGRIRITPQDITLDGIEGLLDSGQLDLSGQIDLKSFQPANWNLALKTVKLPVKIPDTLDLVVDADLKLSGSSSKSNLQGEAILLEGVYYKDINLSLAQAVAQEQREPLPPSPKSFPAFLKNMDFNVTLKAVKPLRVENNLAMLDIRPDMKFIGKPENPLVSGRAVVESGTVEFRKRTFEVKNGTVDFLNPYRIEPTINIESETHIRSWTIWVTLSGTPDRLGFKLKSNPAESDADIVSLLVFGKTTGELIENEGGVTRSAEQLLADMIAKTVADDIKAVSGLDIVEVETLRGNGAGDPERARVTLGKEFSKRLTVKYALESKNGEMVQRAITEYKLLENILLNGFQDNQGVFGGEVTIRLEFR